MPEVLACSDDKIDNHNICPYASKAHNCNCNSLNSLLFYIPSVIIEKKNSVSTEINPYAKSSLPR